MIQQFNVIDLFVKLHKLNVVLCNVTVDTTVFVFTVDTMKGFRSYVLSLMFGFFSKSFCLMLRGETKWS